MSPNAFDTFCSHHDEEIATLVSGFADYEPRPIDRPRFIAWLRQFQAQHQPLALALAQCIRYYGTATVNSLMVPLHQVVTQQVGALSPSVFLVPYGRTCESGNDIVRRYRNVNNLHSLSGQFISPAELQSVVYKHPDPTIVFFDDFIGTGKQVSEGWQDMVSQLVPEYLDLYLAVVAAVPSGVARVEAETPLKVLAIHTDLERCTLGNARLSSAQKNTVRRYCRQAGNVPLGYGDLELLVSFAYGSPNNALSVIRGSEGQRPWRGLLPRWEDLP